MAGGEEGGQEGAQWALRFISGKYQGGEFPLRPNREIIIGRSSDLDMVLVEDMVSRKHAKITTDDHVVTIQDLGSTNGTFVNGEKVRKADLKDGDRILIGTSIIKIVFVDGENTSHLTETEARSKMAVAANKRSASSPKSMAGSIEEIPLPDLLQLLSTSKKSGVLVVHSDRHVGKTFFRKGQIYFASIENQFNIGPRKAMVRMLAWTHGHFELEPPDESAVLEELDDSTEGLLIEGMRQLDEYKVIAEKLPELASPIGIARPLKAKLRELSPEELDVFQAAMEVKTVNALFDQSSLSDLEIAQKLVTLFEKGYLVAG
jgi:pSer/pThr/pTyr-binding forkhead associated (FHA) protein